MLSQQEITEIMQRCAEIGIKGIYETEAVAFAKVQGKEIIDPMLAHLAHDRGDRAAKGVRATAAGPALRKLMLKYTNDKAAEEKRWRTHNEMVGAYNKAYNSGYRPTVETIRKQLDDLYQDGDISISDYEVGNRFLDGDESRRVGNIGNSLDGALSEVK